ncbi:MAG: cysteine desulfurase family protein [Pseudomonadota bacterium]
MTGLNGQRVYLDWNATAPLRPEARAAMLSAMDEIGNPSSVHAEGRKTKAIVERARGQVADLAGCERDEVVFTAGATEAAHLAMFDRDVVVASKADHDCIWENVSKSIFAEVGESGVVRIDRAFDFDVLPFLHDDDLMALSDAQSETGVIHPVSENITYLKDRLPGGVRVLVDRVQGVGRVPLVADAADFEIMSGHKLGGPKGAGALLARRGARPSAPVNGGGQEQGRRAGTENVIGIAGFGAAAEAAKRDLEAGIWARVEKLRNILEYSLEDAASDLIIFGRSGPRLPNTSCFAIPGWKGETQVMQMDLSGFAVSAGSACSSGKVDKASRVLLAMGFDEVTASSAIRVSLGPTTTEAEVMAFADTWTAAYRRWKAKAA